MKVKIKNKDFHAKICRKCLKEKELLFFRKYKEKNRPNHYYSGKCKDCEKQYKKQYKKEYAKKYRLKNQKQIKVKEKEYAIKNKEKIRNRRIEYYKNNKEKINQNSRKCYKKNRVINKERVKNLHGEIWKTIPGYDGIYEVSNKKRVKVLARTILGGATNFPREFAERLFTGKRGCAGLSKGKKNKNYSINTLYQMAFHNFSPQEDWMECAMDNEVVSRRKLVQIYASKNENKTSKYVGVSWSNLTSKWRPAICINKKDVHLGLFENEKEAKIMYEKAVKYSYLYKGIPKHFRTLLNNTTINLELI